MAIGDIFKVSLTWVLDNRLSGFSMHYRHDAGTDSPTLAEELTNQFDAHMTGLLRLALAESVYLQDIYGRRVTFKSPTAPDDYVPPYVPSIPSTKPYAPDINGTIAGDALPNNSCGVAKLVQETETQIRNGRVFISGIPEINVTSGQMEQTYFDGPWRNVVNRLAAPMLPNGGGLITWIPVILSTVETVTNPSPPPDRIAQKRDPPVPLDIVRATSNRRILTQRRRVTSQRSVGLLRTPAP